MNLLYKLRTFGQNCDKLQKCMSKLGIKFHISDSASPAKTPDMGEIFLIVKICELCTCNTQHPEISLINSQRKKVLGKSPKSPKFILLPKNCLGRRLD